MRLYRSIDPLTSASRTIGRGASRRTRRGSSISSPPRMTFFRRSRPRSMSPRSERCHPRVLAERKQRHVQLRRTVRAEEQVERLVEERQVLVPVHEQRAQRRAHVRAALHADPFGRLDGVHHPFAMHVDAGRAQHAAEEQEVGNEIHASVRARIVPTRSPRTLSISSWFFSRMPSVSWTTSASMTSRSSATSAAAQSSVSEMPAALYRSAVRSSCTNAVTWCASRSDAPGTFDETIRSSFSKLGYGIQL